MSLPILIYGAGGFAREVLQIVLDINKNNQGPVWEPLGFVVDEGYKEDVSIHGLPVWEGLDVLKENPDARVVIAVGSSGLRAKIARKIRECGGRFATLVHPLSWTGQNVSIGEGSVICAGSLITTDIEIGSQTHINIGCTIGHDAKLGDYVTLNPKVSISGNVDVANGAEIGTGSVLIPHANVGEWSIVGAGSVVTKPVPANATSVGAPARVIKTRNPGWHCI